MKIPHAALEQRFEEFKNFLKSHAGEEFQGFKKSKFFDSEENYKYEVYESAKGKLNSKFWKVEDIGSGKIIKEVSHALETSVIHNYFQVQNNLINNWSLKDNFKKQEKNRNLEQALFDFYKNKVKDELIFKQLLEEEQPYNLMAYLFFIKDSQKYLPISQERFDEIFALLEVPDFKTRGKASWENYQTFLDLIKQVRDFLKDKDRETTLLDAHSFLWILGGKMQKVENRDKIKPNETDIKNEKEIIKNEEINTNSPKWDFPNSLTKEDIKLAFITEGLLSEPDLRLLRCHYQMNGHRATATQLAKLMNYKKYTVVNLHYARIAKKITELTGKLPFQRKNGSYRWWSLLSLGDEEDNFFPWILRQIVVEAIEELQLFEAREGIFPEEIPKNQQVLIEGSIRQVLVNAYERSPKARNLCIEHHGLNCKVCGFYFEDIYGEAGAGFIHVHHIVPLAEIKMNYQVDPIKDLVPVCPNCHAMLHRFNPVLTIEQLRNMIINKSR